MRSVPDGVIPGRGGVGRERQPGQWIRPHRQTVGARNQQRLTTGITVEIPQTSSRSRQTDRRSMKSAMVTTGIPVETPQTCSRSRQTYRRSRKSARIDKHQQGLCITVEIPQTSRRSRQTDRRSMKSARIDHMHHSGDPTDQQPEHANRPSKQEISND